jgi:hypothetical protein
MKLQTLSSAGVTMLAGLIPGLASHAAGGPAAPLSAGPVKVEIRLGNGAFQLYRGGRPYFIRGAVYWGDPAGKFPLKEIASRGGNSVRSGGDFQRLLDEAHRLDMTVTAGLPMAMESVHHFDYDNARAVREQCERNKAIVLALKDHPALLIWAIGNELEVGYKNRKVWDAVNQVARMIHQLDPNHPAMTVIGDGGVQSGAIREIRARCPDLDLLGINYYAEVEKVSELVRAEGWEKPYVLTEWGPSGDWQVARTAWGASIEETSSEKAAHFVQRYHSVILKDAGRCLGSYAFAWQWRHERTPTWYGMFLESGERTESVGALQYLWSGRWPANRAPRVDRPRIDGKEATDNVYFKPGSTHTAAIHAEDPESGPLSFTWQIMPEVARAGYAGMGERRSQPMPELITSAAGDRLTFAAPPASGPYRVFVFVRDGRGNAATANIPFYVGEPRRGTTYQPRATPQPRTYRFASARPEGAQHISPGQAERLQPRSAALGGGCNDSAALKGQNISAQGERSGFSRGAPPWVEDGVMRSP